MANEKRLIDANELVRKINKLDVFYFTGETDIQIHDCQMIELGAVLAEIDEAPTVDAVEVVRCKYCKHGIWDEEEQMWECILPVDLTGDPDTFAMFHEYNDGEHFCSYGERKDNG